MSRLHADLLGHGEPLVMLHGWGMHSAIWMDFAHRLAEHYQVMCIDLPGHGLSQSIPGKGISALSEALLEAVPFPKFRLLGWSLGAMVALDMVRMAPERVHGLHILAGNPCFVEKHDWPGVKAEVLSRFAEQLHQDPQQTLLRFLGLQVKGLPDAKSRLLELKNSVLARPAADGESLAQGLEILEHTDLRVVLCDLPCPVSVVLGDKDSLVPSTLATALADLRPDIQIRYLAGAGHVPFLTHSDYLLTTLLGLL